MKEFHDKPSAGHLAFQRTYLRVRQQYYWPNILSEIKDYCKACLICTANLKSNAKIPLHPLEIASAPFEMLGIDFLGPISPQSIQGNNHILVITDYFTKWVEATPLPDQKATTTAKALFKHLLSVHGPRKQLFPTAEPTTRQKFLKKFAHFSKLITDSQRPITLKQTA